jgi:hypothetical protein
MNRYTRYREAGSGESFYDDEDDDDKVVGVNSDPVRSHHSVHVDHGDDIVDSLSKLIPREKREKRKASLSDEEDEGPNSGAAKRGLLAKPGQKGGKKKTRGKQRGGQKGSKTQRKPCQSKRCRWKKWKHRMTKNSRRAI